MNHLVSKMKKCRLAAAIWFIVTFGFAIPAISATYDALILDGQTTTGVASAGPFGYTINDNGEVARETFRTPVGGNAFSMVSSLWVRDSQGQSRFVGATNQFASQGVDLRAPIVLNDGSFIASRGFGVPLPGGGQGSVNQIVRVTPNGGTINTSVGPVDSFDLVVLAEDAFNGAAPTGATPNVFSFASALSVAAAANDNGEIAILVNGTGGNTEVVKIAADGQSSVVVGSSNADEFNLTKPDINNSGEVAWLAQLSSAGSSPGALTHAVLVGDGTTPPTRRLEIVANGGSGLGPDINDDGTVVAYQPSQILKADSADVPNDPNNVVLNDTQIDGIVGFVGINDFGQVAYTDASGLYVDGERLIEIGGQFNGETVTQIFFRDNAAFNSSGSIVAEVRTTQEFYGVRFDAPGGRPDTPLVPFASTPSGENDVALNINNGLGVDTPIWVDPVVATGFTYTQGVGGENFATLIIPSALPLGDDTFTLSFEYGSGNLFSDLFGVGAVFDFTAFDPLGISQFTIGGIDVGEGVDPTDPFVVGLTFVAGGFQSTLSIDATTTNTDADPNVVPLPTTILLLLSGFGLYPLLSRIRTKQAA